EAGEQSDADGLGGAADAELAEQLRAIGFDRAAAEAEPVGDELVGLSERDAGQHLALTRRQRRDQRPRRLMILGPRARPCCDRTLQRGEQLVRRAWLFEK